MKASTTYILAGLAVSTYINAGYVAECYRTSAFMCLDQSIEAFVIGIITWPLTLIQYL
ncbi:TMhelix containing protein [Vibrio phage 1.115.B._10N.222.49.B11]|nr:TMhelix containing protein [Vibrio phage 1.115.A._10N.222.49.B11]AUR88589.1 TMhelix containing protein [Vibrio phage 1.115.B._10N.222.49.B11]